MLSYMLPVEDKPPPGPPGSVKSTHLQLSLGRNVSGTPPHNEAAANPGLSNGRGNESTPPSVVKSALVGGAKGEVAPLTNGRGASTPLSKETSVSSFVSDGTATSSMTPTSTGTDKSGRTKLIINGGKHQSLKRVSFGSSKGSMVETLIFESPVQEEPEPSPIPENGQPLFSDDSDQIESEREKVRVTFFQQSRPQEVDLPDDSVIFSDSEFIMSSPIPKNEINHTVYNRTESTESGWDNPFRPGGDLSREADQIVELIKGGKPITPTPGSQAPPLPAYEDQSDAALPNNESAALKKHQSDTQTPKATSKTNGTATKSENTPGSGAVGAGGAVDVTRGTVKPDADAVEHVTIKKKPKCQCCVLQ